MEQLLWTFDEIKPFAAHQDIPVRRWALERLTKLYPTQAGDVLTTMINDKSSYIADKAIDFLAKTGHAETYGPILLDQLQQADDKRFSKLASALGTLRYQPAAAVLIDRINQTNTTPMDYADFRSVCEALGKLGGDEARQTLWNLLNQPSTLPARVTPLDKFVFARFEPDFEPHFITVPVINGLVQAAQPDDITQLVEFYRTLPLDSRELSHFGLYRHPISILAESVQAARLVDEMSTQAEKDLWAMLEQAEWWLQTDVEWSDACFNNLEAAVDRLFLGVVDIVLQEAQRITAERADDLAAWQAAWQAGDRPTGYRQRTLYTLLILQALAAQPKTVRTRRTQESILALALLAQLSVDVDDQALLDNAENKTETLLTILAEPRQQVLPNILDEITALGPEIAPRLIDTLDPEDYGWGTIRIVQAIERIARQYPGCCNAAVSKLIACIDDEQGDYMEEAASNALRAIGVPALPHIKKTLKTTKDMSKEIYLTGALEDIPTEESARVILDQVQSGQPVGEMEFFALADIGSASAIDILYQLWDPGHYAAHLLAEPLFILCTINGVEKPELSQWRQIAVGEEERLEKILAGEEEQDTEQKDKPSEEPEEERPLYPTWQWGKDTSGTKGLQKQPTQSKRKKKRKT